MKTRVFHFLLALGLIACSGPEHTPHGDTTASDPASEPPSATASSAEPETPSSPSAPAASAPAAAAPATPMTASECFKSLAGPVPSPSYDQFGPIVLPSCAGTHHQNITGVERVVFLGDSVTTGTPPTPIDQYYRSRLMELLKKKFGASIESSFCSGWGQRMNDLLENDDEIKTCFPGGVEPKKTLVVMTMGGNDIASWAKDKLGPADAMAQADLTLAQLKAAVQWLKSPEHFPNGSYVVFSNVYEYTDTSGDLASCPAASLSGFSGSYPEGASAVVHLEEGYMKVAVETQTDMMFLLEHFCGHGYRRDDPKLQCYRGPNTPLWFDLTCYHPNPEGHEQIALQFDKVIEGI